MVVLPAAEELKAAFAENADGVAAYPLKLVAEALAGGSHGQAIDALLEAAAPTHGSLPVVVGMAAAAGSGTTVSVAWRPSICFPTKCP